MNIPLQEIIKVHYGKALKSEERNESGQFLVYGSNGIVGQHNESFINYPTLIIGRKGSVGAITFAPTGGWAIDTTFYVEIIDKDEVDLRYLYCVLKTVNLAQHTITTSIPGLNRDKIYQTKIPLPPLEEQKRIAAVLDKADEVRQLRRRSIKKLDSLLQSVFLDMFGDPVSNPKGWNKQNFSDVFEDVSGGNTKIQRGDYLEEGLFSIVDQGKSLIGGFTNDSSTLCKEEPPVIIFGDHTRIFKYIDFPFAMGADGVKVLKPKIKAVTKYLYHYLSLLNLPNAGYDRHFKYLKRTEIVLPNLERQEEFARISFEIEHLQNKQEKAIECFNVLFQSLQQRAFAGELFGAADKPEPLAVAGG